ncbi:MAG: hypothetical protein ABL940_01485 [Bacteroidia bacterium]|jgi:hypothetical protein
MKIVIDIQDKKAPFALELLRSLSFVKNVKPMSLTAVKLYNNLNEAAEQVRLHKQGKLQLKTAQELLNEL